MQNEKHILLNGDMRDTTWLRETESIDRLDVKAIIPGILMLSFVMVAYSISRQHFLLFHTLSELFSIIIAWGLFIVVWNTRQLSENRAFVFIGISYLFIGLMDLIHTLSFKGMGVIDGGLGANPATQLWIAARLMESLSLCAFPLLFSKQIRYSLVWALYSITTAVIIGAVFYWKIFPDCYLEGIGLTPFKKMMEYGICLLLFCAWFLLNQKKNKMEKHTYRILSMAIVFTIMGELAFTFYVAVYDLSNIVGHCFKILSYYFVYLALVKSNLQKPFQMLFRELHTSEKKFKSLFEEMINGIALHEIICDEQGIPINYRFLNVNSTFEKLTGLKGADLIGKTVLEVLPNTEPFWIETYGQVALTGNPAQFDNYSKELNKHFEVKAYRPSNGQFVTVFNDITDKKNADREKDKLIGKLEKAVKEIKTLQGILPICSICKKIRDDRGYWNQIEAYIEKNTEADFSHSICPQCAQKHYPDMDLYGE